MEVLIRTRRRTAKLPIDRFIVLKFRFFELKIDKNKVDARQLLTETNVVAQFSWITMEKVPRVKIQIVTQQLEINK